MAYDRLADSIIKHAKLIVVLWVVILAVAAYPAIQAFGAMSYDIDDMGLDDSESMEGYGIIAVYFPSSDGTTDVSSSPLVVLYYQDGEEHEDALDYATQLSVSAASGMFDDEEGYQKISSFTVLMDTSDLDTGDSGIILILVQYDEDWLAAGGNIISDTPELREQLDIFFEYIGDTTVDVYLTGSPAISYDMETGASEDISHIDVFTVLMVLILVGLFFRSFITSTTPPITIGVAFIVTMGIMFGLTYIMDIFFLSEIMLIVAMMGAGCDYCIFVIARYREELRDGKSHHDALRGAIKWAGESISISAASVIIGFGAMSICSFSMISTMGICLAIGILIALLAALTLIPSILALLGDRIFWPTKIKEYREGGKATRGWFAWCSRVGHAYFDKSSRFTLKHAKAIMVVAVLVTVPAAYVAMTTETSYDMTSSMMTGDSETGMDLLGEYADQGLIYPNYVILEYDEAIATVEIVYDIFGNPSGYGLYWSESWTEEQSASLATLLSNMLDDPNENISTVTGVYQWDVIVSTSGFDVSRSIEEVLALAVTDPVTAMTYLMNAQSVVEYAESVASSSELLVLETAIPIMEATYREYIDIMISLMGSSTQYPDDLLDMAATYMLVTTGGPTLDYIVNVNLGYIGGDFVTFTNVNDTPPSDYSGDGVIGYVTYVKLSAATHDSAMSNLSMSSINYIQEVVADYASDNAFITATWVTGSAVIMYDVSDIISGEFTWIELLVIVLIVILLFFVMRSYTIPFRSVLTILMSICWTLAITHLIFGDDVTWLIPLILLVICLGLGMDYDILLTTRIKENVRHLGMTNDEAIHHAVIHSGSVITICGLIMGGAFGTLMLSSMDMLQQFGFALCFAILVDALIVRTYIVPAVMHLLGDWNWKGPRFLMAKADKAAQDEDQ